MTKNPFINGLLAITYIVTLVGTAINIPRIFGGPEESIFYPMIGLSVFVLSTALMGLLFVYQPALMILDGKREEAVTFFLKSIAIFFLGIIVLFVISRFVSAPIPV